MYEELRAERDLLDEVSMPNFLVIGAKLAISFSRNIDQPLI